MFVSKNLKREIPIPQLLLDENDDRKLAVSRCLCTGISRVAPLWRPVGQAVQLMCLHFNFPRPISVHTNVVSMLFKVISKAVTIG